MSRRPDAISTDWLLENGWAPRGFVLGEAFVKGQWKIVPERDRWVITNEAGLMVRGITLQSQIATIVSMKGSGAIAAEFSKRQQLHAIPLVKVVKPTPIGEFLKERERIRKEKEAEREAETRKEQQEIRRLAREKRDREEGIDASS